MGHQHLGVLPKTRRWNQVLGLLHAAPHDIAAVSSAVLHAAERDLDHFGAGVPVAYNFYLLTRLAHASRGDFEGELRSLGLPTDSATSAVDFARALAEHSRQHLGAEVVAYGKFTELSSKAMRAALTKAMGQQAFGLFDTSLGDIQAAFRQHSSRDQFAKLAQDYFGNLFTGTLHSYLDREVPRQLGQPGSRLNGIQDKKAFDDALRTYGKEAAFIVHDFARDWYSKANWQTEGDVGFSQARDFTSLAMHKLRDELQVGTK